MVVNDILRLVNEHCRVIIDTKNSDGTYTILEECPAVNVSSMRSYAEVMEVGVMNDALVITI